jgi:toxin-antitoxin system PIN domain toxin
MTVLLDINVLIARTDPAHGFHQRAKEWLLTLKNASVATCPMTENGFLRIYGHPSYPEGPGSPQAAKPALNAIRLLPGHTFIPDDVAIGDTSLIPSMERVGHQQLTDLYLLALAVSHGAMFATFDRKIDPSLVIGGQQALLVIR